MTTIGPKDPNVLGLRAAKGLETPDLPTLQQAEDGIQAHLWGFVDVEASREQGEAVITARSTNEMLRALGVVTLAGGQILTKPFSIPQGHASYAELDRMKEGIRDAKKGIRADTGTFSKDTGHVNADKAIAFWHEIAGAKGFVTKDDVQAFVTGEKKHQLGPFHTREVGKVLNELEIRLLFDIAAQVDTKGDRVLTADRFIAFVDGSLWGDLAKARSDGTLYQPRPVGALVHEGAKKIATGLAELASSYGATAADAGTSAAHQGDLTIDVEASLRQQQKSKTLLPTIGGAMKALCPVGFG